MQSIMLEIPEKIVFQLKLPPKRAKQMLMEELVLRLYEQSIITSAQGAALLNMQRLRFEQFLAEHEVAIHGEPEELDTDLRNLERVL
jgi:predicted HTH domain antitoxin